MGNTNILIVDDEQDIREALKDILDDEGHKVFLAENAEVANKIKEEKEIGLILLDIWMPDCDGITLLKEWAKANEINCPVIMMSGHGTIDTAIEATKIGAYDFLEKPISLQKLLNTINSALKKEIQVAKIDLNFLNNSQLNWIVEFRKKLVALKSSGLIYLIGQEGNFINLCINSLVGTNYLLIDPATVIKDNFIEKAAQKGCNAILFKNLSKFEKIKKENIQNYIKLNTHKKIKIIVIDDFIEKSASDEEVKDDNILFLPNFKKNKDLIPDFSLAILNFYLSMNKYIGYKEFEVSALNSLRISSITNIDLLDNVIFNLIKGTEGSKISSEDVGLFLDGLKVNESLNNGTEESSFVTEGSIFKKPLKEAREEFEKLYFEFHMQNQASVSELSKKSGVERTHLYRKLKSLGIKSK